MITLSGTTTVECPACAIVGPKMEAAKDRLPSLLQRYKDFDKLTK